MASWAAVVFSAALAAVAFAGACYPVHASKYDLPIGLQVTKDWWMNYQTSAIGCALWCSWMAGSWSGLVAAVIGGFFGAWAILVALGPRTQLAALPALPICLGWAVATWMIFHA